MESNEINAIADRISDKLIAIVKKQLGEPRAQPGPRWVKASTEPPVGTPILIYTDGLCLGFYKYWPVGYNGNSEAVYVDLNGRGPISATEVIYWMLPPVHPHEQPAADSKSEPKLVKGALQWAKETIDFAWDYVKVPESLGETWGNMYMNTMHAIQQAQQEIEQPAAGEEKDAAFAMLNYIQDELFRGSDRINGILVGDIYRAFKQHNP